MFVLVIALPVIVWRLHVSTTMLLILIGTFGLGFAAVWFIVIVGMGATCVAPSCTWAGPEATAFDGIAELLPPVILVGAVIAIRQARARRVFAGAERTPRT
jgi:hypothetical protein